MCRITFVFFDDPGCLSRTKSLLKPSFRTGYYWKIALIYILLCGGKMGSVSAQQKDVFEPLDGGAIRFSGYFQQKMTNSLEHWNMGVVPYRAFVNVFREGRTYFAEGEMWGKAVRSGAMFYRYTHDPRLKKLLSATVADLLTTRRKNGSISASPVAAQPDGPGGDLWERTYVLLGLEQYYRWVDPDPKVLEAMIDEADCTLSQIGPAPKTSILDQGWSPNHIESSTILEPIMRLYQMTGYKRYLDFARYIVEAGGAKGYNIIRQAAENVPPYKMGGPYPKAYEMMSLFEGLTEYYRVTGDTLVRKAVLNLYHNIIAREITLIGNGGGDQPYHPAVYGEAWDNTAFEQTNPAIQRMMETCAGVTWLKLCGQVLRLTGDPSAVDMMEKYVYNGLFGAMRPDGKGFSYVNLLNGIKTNPKGWGGTLDGVYVTCCNLNGPLGLAYLPYLAVMQSGDGPVINFYNAATVKAVVRGKDSLRLNIQTDYPRSGNIRIQVDPRKPASFAITLHIPAWSKETVLRVNGRPLQVTPGTYRKIQRTWTAGDEISLALDLRCRVIPSPGGSTEAAGNFVAVVRGPVVLARDENIDPHYRAPVRILAKDGYTKGVTEDPALPGTFLQLAIPTAEGNIRMVDYASVNNWNGKHLYTWLPVAETDSLR